MIVKVRVMIIIIIKEGVNLMVGVWGQKGVQQEPDQIAAIMKNGAHTLLHF